MRIGVYPIGGDSIMKGLGKRLRAGFLEIDPMGQRVIIQKSSGDERDLIPYAELDSSAWGYVYEAFVAQNLRGRGYQVELVGLVAGYLDGGMDLVARQGEETIFVQCKFLTASKIGRQRMEWLLYKASAYIQRYSKQGKCQFWLVVPSIEQAFGRRRTKQGKQSFPIAEYFLSKNSYQSQVRLHIEEIPMLV